MKRRKRKKEMIKDILPELKHHIPFTIFGAATAIIAIFLFLFISVWIPCCISDIVFSFLFVGKANNK
jgi:hypothetical protein